MKKFLSLTLCFICLYSLTACTQNSNDAVTTTVASSTVTETNTNINTTTTTTKVTEINNIEYQHYKGVLNEVSYAVSDFCEYSVYDIDDNGINELILKVGTCEADYKFHFYSIVDDSIVELGKMNGSHCVLYANENGKGIINVLALQGYQTVTHITVANLSQQAENYIRTEIIKEGSVGNDDYYSNSSPLSVCYTKDKKLLLPNAELIGQKSDFNYSGNMDYSFDTFFQEIPIDMNIIGTDFFLFQKKTSNTIMPVDSIQIHNMHVTIRENQMLYGIFGYVNEYVIVENGIIVGYLTYNGSTRRDMSMKQYFPHDDFYRVEPKIAKGEDSFSYCCWKTSDAYIVLGATAQIRGIGNYHNWPTTTYIILQDFSQFDYFLRII